MLNPKQFGPFSADTADYSNTAHAYGAEGDHDNFTVTDQNTPEDTQRSADQTADEYKQQPGSDGWVGSNSSSPDAHQSMNNRPAQMQGMSQGQIQYSLSKNFVPNMTVGRSNLN
jgi:hypothetical protein